MSQNAHTLPIFPLSNVTLFPGVRTPLHIFEPRYRQMTEDALAGDRRIAMAVVLPEHLGAMAGDPPVFPVACAGVIRDSQRLADGRFNIVLLGTHRVRILAEPERPAGRLYRVASVEPLADVTDPEGDASTLALRERVAQMLAELFENAGPSGEDPLQSLAAVENAAFVNALCNGLPFSTPEKQSLLEADGVRARFLRLIDLLDFALAERRARRVPNSGTFH